MKVREGEVRLVSGPSACKSVFLGSSMPNANPRAMAQGIERSLSGAGTTFNVHNRFASLRIEAMTRIEATSWPSRLRYPRLL